MVHIPGTGNNTTAQNTTSTSSTSNMNTTSNTSRSSNPLSETKAKISSFLGRDGQADTTVHETINPAVEHEHISRAQREERQKVIDREIHQEHHHTTVQPVVDHEVAPTTHTSKVEGVETREIKHGNDAKVRQELEAERAQFRNTQDVAPTVVTEQQAPTVAGEHIHHHVHENIQPVIERDIHQEHVIHTVKPVHEIHQNETIHHGASVLPPVDVGTFKQQGGNFGGRQERVDAFQGPPKPIENATNHTIGGPGAQGTTTVTGKDGRSRGTGLTGSRNRSGSSSSSSSDEEKRASRVTRNGGATDSSRSGLGHTNASAGGTGLGAGSAGTGSSSTAAGQGSGYNASSGNTGQTAKTGSIIDKLNPAKDSTGRGEPGFMH